MMYISRSNTFDEDSVNVPRRYIQYLSIMIAGETHKCSRFCSLIVVLMLIFNFTSWVIAALSL